MGASTSDTPSCRWMSCAGTVGRASSHHGSHVIPPHRRTRCPMSFNDLGKKDAPQHVDTPAQAEARAAAVADLKTKADAKAAKAATQREAKRAGAPAAAPAAKPNK